MIGPLQLNLEIGKKDKKKVSAALLQETRTFARLLGDVGKRRHCIPVMSSSRTRDFYENENQSRGGKA